MDTKALYYFQAVYEEGNIHTAAKKRFISPQGLGKIIKGLEAELGGLLFIRTKSGVVPTESGKYLYEKSRKILQEIQEMKRQIHQMNREKNELRIGFAAGTLKVLALDKLFQWMDAHPEWEVSWSECENEKVLTQLKEGALDYGFVTSKTESASLQQTVAANIPLVVLVYEGHPFWELNQVNIEMLREQELVVMNEQFHIYYDFMQMCQIQGFEPRIRAKTMDGETLYQLCKQKIGLAVCPAFSQTVYEGLKAIPFEEEYSWNIYETWNKARNRTKSMELFQRLFSSPG